MSLAKTIRLFAAALALTAAVADGAENDKKALKVLMIGNSYSICVLNHMPKVAADCGCPLDLCSLYIGGCPMERHVANIANPTSKPYQVSCSWAFGEKPAFPKKANIPEMLAAEKWDVVTVQQASHFSFSKDSYHPYGEKLLATIRQYAPQAEVVVQETWSDQPESKRLARWSFTSQTMYAALHECYADFAKLNGLRVIPTGTAVEFARGVMPLQAPKGNPHLGKAGEYLQALVWTARLFGVDVTTCGYAPEDMSADQAAALKAAAMKAVRGELPASARLSSERGDALTLGAPFNDGAVLQRDRNVPVWGKAAPGAKVTVAFAGQSVETVAGADGRWRVDLKPLKTSSLGRDLVVTAGDSKRTLKDVLVGEVWLCSGQSNMQQPLGGGGNAWSEENGSIEAKLTDEPDIRYASFGGAPSATVKEFLKSTNAVWKAFKEENLYRFANVPYHFAMNVRRGLKGVPIGLLHAAVGGSNIRPWISPDGYAAVPELDDLKTAGTLLDETTPEGKKRGFWGLAGQPTVFYNSHIAPIGPYALRGLIWYQGESNISDGDRYRLYLHALVKGWRKALENPDMDAYVVQLMPYLYRKAKDTALGELWTAQQKFVAEDPHAAYVVADDLGLLDEIHSYHKRNVGLRLALCALNRQYGRKDLEYRSPRLKSAKAEAGRVAVEFEFGGRLYTPVYQGKVRNFELAGKDGVWHAAVGTLQDAKLTVQSDAVAVPTKIRYMYRQGMQGDLYACGTHLMPGAFVADVEQPQLESKEKNHGN